MVGLAQVLPPLVDPANHLAVPGSDRATAEVQAQQQLGAASRLVLAGGVAALLARREDEALPSDMLRRHGATVCVRVCVIMSVYCVCACEGTHSGMVLWMQCCSCVCAMMIDAVGKLRGACE
jgi:hypothetical protein